MDAIVKDLRARIAKLRQTAGELAAKRDELDAELREQDVEENAEKAQQREEVHRQTEDALLDICQLESRLQYEETWGADARKAYPKIRERIAKGLKPILWCGKT